MPRTSTTSPSAPSPCGASCARRRFRLRPVAPPTRLADAPPLILGVGRLVEKKGFDDLIRACALLRDQGQGFRCAIVGKGEDLGALRGLIAQLGLEDLG